MRIRYQLALAIFLTGCLGVTALLADRAGFTRQILFGRAEARALAIAESIGRLVLPHMQNPELNPLSKGISAFAELPNVAYLRISDEQGRLVHESTPERFSAEPGTEDQRMDVRAQIKDPATGKSYGSVHVGVPTSGLRETLRALAWRGAAIGMLAIATLALVALTIGTLLGRKLEILTEAVEGLKNDELRAVSLRREDSEVDRLASAFSALHQRLRDEEDKLKRLEAYKNELTSMLVHDMKHPVAVLGAALAALERGEWARAPEQKKVDLLAVAKAAIGRENGMIEDILQLAKLKHSEMPLARTRISLGWFLEDCARENALIAAQSGRPWRAEFEELSGCWIFGDAASLRRLIGNLMLNAVDHTPAGTPISLGARLSPRNGSKVEIFIRDDGPGLPAEQRECIFRALNGGGAAAEGLGVGLSYCRIVAEKHSGRLEVTSSPGEGTLFALVLPVSSRAINQEAVQ